MSKPAASVVRPMHTAPDRVVVIGGGWAGLAAGVELARHGLQPIVLEAARTLGGRARSMRLDNSILDNGQHLLLGAYRSVLSTLDTIGVQEETVLRRVPLGLTLKSVLGAEVKLQTRRLPAPLHLVWALAQAHGLGLGARLAVLRLLTRARRDRFDVQPDVALMYYLRQCRQPADITRTLWQPLCQAALATSIERASTRLFLRVLGDFFFGRRTHSDLLIPTQPLIECLPRPAMEYIETHGGSVRVGARVQQIRVDRHGSVTGVQLRDQLLPTRHVILATPPDAAATLLREHPATLKLAQQLERIDLHPVTTLYIQYPPSVRLPMGLIGVLDGSIHWLLGHAHDDNKPGLLTAIVTGPGTHTRLSNDALTTLMMSDIARLYPDWPAPLGTRLVREKRATVAATPEVEALRPKSPTPIKGLWLAGDYTAAGYPGSLETAVRSGIVSARRILRGEQRRND